MKITDLKENDVIHIRNKKEAKGIAKLLSHLTSATIQKESAKQMVKEAVDFYGNEACINTNNNTYLSYGDIGCYKKTMCNIIPASKFLKPSLKKRVKELEKWRKKLEQPKTAADMEVHFDEVERLPEKWCVKANNETELELIYNSICSQPEAKNLNYYYHFPATDNNICWAHISVQIGYTEISFETFKRLVLKEDEKPVGLETGKWYKLKEDSNCVACYKGEHSAYGIKGNGIWSTDIKMSQIDYWQPATDEEVKEALIKEAERRGFKEGVKVDVYGVRSEVLRGDFKYLPNWIPNEDALSFGNDVIFRPKKGWAEIISKPEVIDFSKAGQLVERNGELVVTYGTETKETFTGAWIPTVGRGFDPHQRYFNKNGFKLSSQQLTLSN